MDDGEEMKEYEEKMNEGRKRGMGKKISSKSKERKWEDVKKKITVKASFISVFGGSSDEMLLNVKLPENHPNI